MDTVKAGFLGGTLQIVFDMASPTKAEIESICNKNPLKIAYTVVDSVLFFCIKPNGIDYQTPRVQRTRLLRMVLG